MKHIGRKMTALFVAVLMAAVSSMTAFADERIDISEATVTLDKDSYEYTGEEIRPETKVVVDGKELIYQNDYSLSYANNIYPGNGQIAVFGIFGYEGSKFIEFPIIKKSSPDPDPQPDPKPDPKPAPKQKDDSSDDYDEELYIGSYNANLFDSKKEVTGEWTQNPVTKAWSLTVAGKKIVSSWRKVANPYAPASMAKTSWFYFDENGEMLTGWQWIKCDDGLERCYYLNPNPNGILGACFLGGTTPDGYTVDRNGAWTVNGKVQTR